MRWVTVEAELRPGYGGQVDAWLVVGTLADHRKLARAPYEPEPSICSWSGKLHEREVKNLLWLANEPEEVKPGVYEIDPGKYAEDGWPFEAIRLRVSERCRR